jgi:acetoacetate decarboxylase
VLLHQVRIQGDRTRCCLCGEPVELDDPLDEESWIHAPDANDFGDHTAEV